MAGNTPEIAATAARAAELRKMNEAFGDSEFELALAPYNNYTGGTPAEKAKYEGLFKGAGVYNKRGQYTPANFTAEDINRRENQTRFRNKETGRMETLNAIPDMVQAIAGGATPKVWQHEYNHRNNPDRSESTNRHVDGIIAPNERAWKDAVKLKLDDINARQPEGEKRTLEYAERRLLADIVRQHGASGRGPHFSVGNVYKEEIERGGRVPVAMQTPNLFMEYSETDHLKDYSRMRQGQVYWPKALRAMQERDAVSEPK